MPAERPNASWTEFAMAGVRSHPSPHARRIYLPAAFVKMLVAVTMAYSLRAGAHMTEVYAPLVDAAMEIKFQAALGHLWLEEVISGVRKSRIERSTVAVKRPWPRVRILAARIENSSLEGAVIGTARTM